MQIKQIAYHGIRFSPGDSKSLTWFALTAELASLQFRAICRSASRAMLIRIITFAGLGSRMAPAPEPGVVLSFRFDEPEVCFLWNFSHYKQRPSYRLARGWG